jgi:hypothetical protein
MEGIPSVGVVSFSDAAMDSIVAMLPSGCRQERVALLPNILREWAEQDLRSHPTAESRAAVQERQKQLRNLGRQARTLIEVFAKLDETGLSTAALYTESQPINKPLWKVNVTAARQRQADGFEWLGDLAVTFENWVEPGVTLGRPKRGISYRILLDLGAVYQFVTGERPSRQVRGGDHPDRGKDYGPFWDFASIVWHAIFGNGAGLSYAMKDFAAGRAQFRDYSPIIANMGLRHPEWGIFDG